MSDPATIVMREPCPRCGGTAGLVTETSGQDIVRCAATGCGTYVYTRPKAESGKPQRTVRTRPTMKPKVRARVLAAHDNRCVWCGRGAGDVILAVDHLLPVEVARRHGFDMAIIESELNLAPACEECNLGRQDDVDTVSTAAFMLLVAKNARRLNGGVS